MISVIVPLLNEARYIKRFLDSLAYQTFKDFEVVIIDGGSTDRSRNIVDQFKLGNPDISFTTVINETRNIGFIRNYGAKLARGSLLFHTSSDVVFNPEVFRKVYEKFYDCSLISLTGKTVPISDSVLCHVAYRGFDLLRWFFSKLPSTLRKYRPGGNFLVIRTEVFDYIAGFPEVTINEDGLLGQKIDLFLLEMAKECGARVTVSFDLGLCVHHHVKRFEEKGSVKTILFYLYVFANLFPILKPVLYGVEKRSAEIFKNRSDLRDFSK